jgi:chemotaxis family two-component system response regulator Rcp1
MVERMDVLLVEDNVGDVRLAQEAFRGSDQPIKLHVANNGVEAMAFLRKEGVHARAPRPNLILLDLNLPKMDGREVLVIIKEDAALKSIPTIILTTSELDADVDFCYRNGANCYLRKPKSWDDFHNIVKSVNTYWFALAKLPN